MRDSSCDNYKKGGERRPDSQQLVRQWALLRLLCSTEAGMSVKELAGQLETTKTTIERDLATLQQTFALLDEQEGKQKRVYRIDQTAASWST